MSAADKPHCHAQRIKGLYSQLTALVTLHHQHAFGVKHIQASRQFSAQLITELKQYPEPLFAQILLPKANVQTLSQLSLNVCILTATVAIRNHLNDTATQQLVCAALTCVISPQKAWQDWLSRERSTIPTVDDKRLKLALQKTGHHLWLQSQEVTHYIEPSRLRPDGWPAHLTTHQQIVLIALSLSLPITANTPAPQMTMFAALKQIALALPAQCMHLINSLIDFPGTLPPGSILNHRTEEGQIPVIITRVTDKAVKAAPFNMESNTETVSINRWPSIRQIYKTSPPRGWHVMDQWWNQEWQTDALNDSLRRPVAQPTFKVTSPPPDLLNIQDKVQQPSVNTSELSDLIERQPLLASYIQDSATQISRLQLPARTVRQSLMMHGFERTVSILTERALSHRLNQHHFPVRPHVNQFTQLATYMAAGLAHHVATDKVQSMHYLAEQISLLTLFVCSPLFTHPSLKVATNWQPSTGRLFDACQLVESNDQQGLAKHTHSLALAWHQPRTFLIAIQQHATLPQQLPPSLRTVCTCVGTALALSRQLFFPDQPTCVMTEEYLAQARQIFNLTETSLVTFAQQSAAEAQARCPI
ncbi:hypothetical protein [Aestuariibacter salexigens]|uniref:hypothetical protein n=1 Tax=Aestuariibacter salexigens TaxID=226010 RepID=UPI000400B42C|nr:hypothetical protein [Aestuariibacter salexigens]